MYRVHKAACAHVTGREIFLPEITPKRKGRSNGMKYFMKTKAKRITSAFLSAVLCIMAIPLSAFAFVAEEGKAVNAYYGDYYTGSDGEHYHSTDFNFIVYDENGNTSLHSHEGGGPRRKLMVSDSSGDRQLMCLESGVDYGADSTYQSMNGRNSAYFQNLPADAQFGIMLASVYGWHPGRTAPIGGTNEDDFSIATQTILWEYQQQLRTSPTSLHENGYGVRGDSYFQCIQGRPAELCYNWILDQMNRHMAIPSFASSRSQTAEEYTLKYNPAAKNYSLTITDNNNTMSDIKFDGGGVSVSRDGNQYTFTSANMIENAVTITAQKQVPGLEGNFLLWGHPGKQTMVSGAEDPVVFYIKVKTETTGIGHIVKHSEDGKVDGIRFTVSGNGVNRTVTTKADGTVDLELMPGVYTVTELTEEKYEPQGTQKVTIISGGTSTVTFSNVLKRGSLKVTKTCEDGLAEGIRFHLYGTSLSGLPVDEYAVTNRSGIAEFKNVLVGSGYVLEEVDTAVRYVVPEKQTAAIEWNKVTNKSFHNKLKKWQLTVTKSDSETGEAQGDATLAGAVYGIYNDGQLVDTYVIDGNGQFTTKYYICGDSWSLQEISASEGYLVTSGSEHIGAEAKLYTVEYNSAALSVLETVQKGKIAIIKHTDDGETQIETPEAGAEFEVFLKSSGSYEGAKESERDILVCDEFGFAETKELPYGVYTVKQTKGWNGRELMDAFDVFVKKDGEVYRYLINNEPFKSYIKVIKTDAETGKAIPYAGAAFQIYRPDGSKVEMTYTYPEITTIDTFYTTADGMLITPQQLDYGYGYSLVEVSAPYGYVLNSDPVYFDVTEDNSTEESAVTIIKVERPNMPQKGTITVSKSGEVFSSVTAVGGGYVDEEGNDVEFPVVYQPVYDVAGLEGAVYEVTAAEDVITPDGTLRYAKGTVVAEVTTDSEGKAVTEPLYLGRYEVKEISAPYGMVLNDEIHSVELTYAGQEVEITETSASFYNERQKVEISLEKMLAQDERFQLGMNGEIISVQFGLFAAEDLTAADGSEIPTDGLMEIINCDENGSVVFQTDIPVGAKLYVKEVSTDSHYILPEEKYPVEFVYARQDTALVEIKANDGEAIENDLIYGAIKGLKIDRETEETIEGALFGLFKPDENDYTESTAILTAKSQEDGIFMFENIPYGNWVIRELAPAEGFLPNTDLHHVQVGMDEQVIEITVVNDRIPEIGTKAEVDGEKEICATEVFTLTDTVSYKHLIPGKEYTIKGVLMDKKTGKPLVINGEEIHSETIFTPDEPSGEVAVEFTFDAKYIKEDTDIVVFESLQRGGMELAVHADLTDEGQTVQVKVPEIGTKATIEGKKEITANGNVTIEDVVSYKNLTPGKEYTINGILMDKATGKELLVNGDIVTSGVTFIPEQPDGEVTVSFTFDASGLAMETQIVVFEKLYREGVELAAHADIEDEGQTVAITPPAPDVPKTGDEGSMGFWIGLGAIALGGIASIGIIYLRQKKDDGNE